MPWRLGVVAAAVLAAVVPLPPALVERLYARGVYPAIQRGLTTVSDQTSFALFDVVWTGLAAWWLVALAHDVWAARRTDRGRAAGRILTRTILTAAIVYLAFLATWGLNYRRVPLGDRLGLDMASTSPDALRALTLAAVEQLNSLHPRAHAMAMLDWTVDPALAAAFETAQAKLGVRRTARPARPKVTLLDAYFRAAGVNGMTAPFFAETLLPSDLLPVERPAVIAHEWGHLAGFADEGEAGFVGWLTCLSGPDAARYSGWLAIYIDAAAALPREDRPAMAARLAPGPIADLQAMAARRNRNVNRAVSEAGWEVYDRYLRANRVESGTASYGEVLRLVLGTDVGRRAWQTP